MSRAATALRAALARMAASKLAAAALAAGSSSPENAKYQAALRVAAALEKESGKNWTIPDHDSPRPIDGGRCDGVGRRGRGAGEKSGFGFVGDAAGVDGGGYGDFGPIGGGAGEKAPPGGAGGNPAGRNPAGKDFSGKFAGLSAEERRLADALRCGQTLILAAAAIGVAPSTARRWAERLRDKGVAARILTPAGGRWRLTEEYVAYLRRRAAAAAAQRANYAAQGAGHGG